MPAPRPQVFAVALLALSAAAFAQPTGLGGGGDVQGTPPPAPDRASPDKRPDSATRQAESGEVSLLPKFIQGRVTRYTWTIDSTQSTSAPKSAPTTPDRDTIDLNSTVQMKQQLGLKLEVIESGEHSATLKMTFDSARIELDLGDDRSIGQSGTAAPAPGTTTPAKQPAANPDDPIGSMAQMAADALTGTTLILIVDSSGKITKVSGTEALGGLAGAIGSLGGGVAGLAGVGGGGTGNAGSSNGLGWLISGVSGQPARARLGQTWSNVDQLSGTPVGDLHLATKYQVRSVKGGLAEITFDGRIQPASENSASGSGFQVRESTYRGSYTWDSATGELGRMNADLATIIEMRAAGIDRDLSSKTRMTIERLAR